MLALREIQIGDILSWVHDSQSGVGMVQKIGPISVLIHTKQWIAPQTIYAASRQGRAYYYRGKMGEEVFVPGNSLDLLPSVKAVIQETNHLLERYGPIDQGADSVFFHTTRAFRLLQEALLEENPDPAYQVERLIHLAAVCTRAAEALGGR